MAHHQNEFCLQVLHRIFDAAQNVVCGNVAGYPDHEQIAQALIEDELRGDPGIGATEDNREWMLSSFQLFTTGEALVWMLLFVPRIALIALHKPGKSAIGRDNGCGFLRPSGGGQNEEEAGDDHLSKCEMTSSGRAT